MSGLFTNTQCVQVREHGREKGFLLLQVVLHHLDILLLIAPSHTYRLSHFAEPFGKQLNQRLIASVCLSSNQLDFPHFLFISRYPLLQDPLQQNAFRMEPHHPICTTRQRVQRLSLHRIILNLTPVGRKHLQVALNRVSHVLGKKVLIIV